MRIYKRFSFVVMILALCAGPAIVSAATTPSFGVAATFGVLSTTYTNSTISTVINGNLGYTIAPAVNPVVNGTTYVGDATYNQAGIDQGIALASLNGEGCTYTFPPGAIDLSTDITHGAIGVYQPGVYCSVGAMDVGGPLVLSGNGTYIFRTAGALTSTVGATVSVINGASACDIFWTPTQATTFAANTTFIGTVIDDAGITIGANTTWQGMALSFATTITTDTTTITVPVCSSTLATLHVIKQVINVDGGAAIPSAFNLYVKFSGSNVVGSPASGMSLPGSSYFLNAGVYNVSEDVNSSYAQSFTGDCDLNGNITLATGDNKTCTIINSYIPVVAPTFGGGGGVFPPNMTGTIHITTTGFTVNTTGTIAATGVVFVPQTITPLPPRTNPLVPLFPNTGVAPESADMPRNFIVAMSLALCAVASIVLMSKRYRH